MIETYLKRRWNIADLNRDIAVPWRDSACSAAARLFSFVFTAPWRIFRADARCWHGICNTNAHSHSMKHSGPSETHKVNT